MPHLVRLLSALGLLAASSLQSAALAQTLDYGGADGGSAGSSDGADPDGEASAAPSHHGGHGGGHGGGRTTGIKLGAYIEAAQIVDAELSPGNDVLTYSEVAAGVDATIAGRYNAASASLRYERRFGWGKARDSDTISGIARGYATITPGLRIEAGALAARTNVQGNGSSVISPLAHSSSESRVYSVYAGPSIATHAGDLDVTADYRIGYSKVESPDSVVTAPGQTPVDIFDESVAHVADVHAGFKPGTVLPVGLGAGAGYYREDVSNLDQRIEDFHARADITVPVSPTLALVGGVGYEDVKISARDAVRDANGLPVVGPDGRFVTDKSVPRQIAYDSTGIIWDAGVIWRPSRRTAFEAHVGRRYGTTSYYGSFAYAPNERSALNIAVYDNLMGFGGRLNQALVDLPTDFEATRNPLTGDVTGCVSSLEKGSCITGALGSIRSSTFRSRGVMATYSVRLGRISAGIGGGYDRHKYIAAAGTVLAIANGVVDENYWLAAYLNGRIDRHSHFTTNAYVNWFQTGSAFGGDTTAFGATAAYIRDFNEHLSATAAVGIDGLSQQSAPDTWSASGLVGVRYTF